MLPEQKGNVDRRFPDAESFWTAVKGDTDCKHRVSRKDESKERKPWSGTKSFEEAMKLAELGWAEGATKCKAMTDQLTVVLGSMVRVPEVVFDVTGDCMDMGAVMEGCPEHWMSDQESEEEVRDQSHGRMVRISVNVSAASNVPAEWMVNRAAAIAAFVEIAERSGRVAEIICCEGVDKGKHIWSYPAKRVDEPLQMDRLAFSCGHPSMLRRIAFSLQETEPRSIRSRHGFEGGCYGSPADLPKDHSLRGDIHFGELRRNDPNSECFSTLEGAEKRIKQLLKEQGIIAAD